MQSVVTINECREFQLCIFLYLYLNQIFIYSLHKYGHLFMCIMHIHRCTMQRTCLSNIRWKLFHKDSLCKARKSLQAMDLIRMFSKAISSLLCFEINKLNKIHKWYIVYINRLKKLNLILIKCNLLISTFFHIW